MRECLSRDNGQSFAVKIIDQESRAISWGSKSVARQEADLLASLNHKNIVTFIEVYEDKQFLYVIMEKCTGGEVFERLIKQRRFTEIELVDFCRQMFSALEYIHSMNMIHRDIKAENFLYAEDGSIKLVDFGLAVKVKPDTGLLRDVVGSPHYIAPEMLERKYTYPVDMWSAGVLLYLMLYGRYPFDAETDDQIIRRIRAGGINWESPDCTPSGAILKLLQKLLQTKPGERFTPLAALNDPFLSNRVETDETASNSIIITETVAERLNSSVVIPTKSRRKDMMYSEAEKKRNIRISELEKQFEEGLHRGWRKSHVLPLSAPSSPRGGLKSPLGRQATKGLLGVDHSTMMSSSDSNLGIDQAARAKRSRSVPSIHVTFDTKPPDLFVYTDGSPSLVKIGGNTKGPKR